MGSWMNNDGLYVQYGPTKAVAETTGDFLALDSNRIIEATVPLVGITAAVTTAAPLIISNNTFFPSGPAGPTNWYIEKVELVVETAATGASAVLNVGLIQQDRVTVPSGYSAAFVTAAAVTTLTPAGVLLTLVNGSTGAGSLIGSAPAAATGPYYITVSGNGTNAFTAGSIKIRIFYHGIGTISQ